MNGEPTLQPLQAVPGTVVVAGSQVSPGGEQGPSGITGATGTAWSLSTTSFTVPAVGATASITVQDAGWIAIGEIVYVDKAASDGTAAALVVTNKVGNTLTLLNPQLVGITLANTTQSGLLNQVSGNANDYVGGDNVCHPIASAPIPIIGGRLQYVSITQLSFKPFNGSFIKINGVFYQIPNTGIVGLNTTNVFVNGVAGQNLAGNNTQYYVYCFNNAGVLTADFSTTLHVTSTTLGNEGVETKSGDASRTLIGLVNTGGGAAGFFDTQQYQFVRSWLNRKRAVINGAQASGATGSTNAWIAGAGAFAVCWGDECVQVSGCASMNHSVANAQAQFILTIDSANVGPNNICATSPTATLWATFAVAWATPVTEGLHSFGVSVWNYTPGTLSFNTTIAATIA